ncbi:unnamed protein product [Closterium sp. NIES-54]
MPNRDGKASSGSSDSAKVPQVQALLEAVTQEHVVARPTIGLSEAQRFNGNNYSTWRLKFMRRAREVDIWPFYKADEETEEGVPPPATATAQEKRAYKKKSLQAFFQLCHSVSDSIAVGLDQFADDINSAQRAWAYMEAVYLGRTDTNLTAVRKKLLLLAMEPMEKIIDYVKRAKSYNDDLTGMGAPESEKHMMGYIISGLPKEWTAEIGILTCNTPKDMTQVLETLQALELVKSDLKRREAVATAAEVNMPANLNATATPRDFCNCYNCGKKGHKAADCYSNPNGRNYQGKGLWQQNNDARRGEGYKASGGFNGNCNHCGKFGHKASDCYHNRASRNFRGKELQQQRPAAAAKTNLMEAPAVVEETPKVDAILGGAHKANVARASEVCLLSKGFKETAWFMDSGCTQHMTHRADWLRNYRESGVPYVLLGDEGKLQVQGEGDLILQSPYGELKMDNVLLVEKLSLNLISQTQLDSSGCKTFSDNGKLWVFGPNWKLIAEGARTEGLYEMKLKEHDTRENKIICQPEPEEGEKAREELRTMLENTAVTELQQLKLPVAAVAETVDINLLHKRMGHASTQRIKESMKKDMAAGVKVNDVEETHTKCDSCVEGKVTKAPHPRHGSKEPYGAMEVVAADVCGPMRVTSRHDSRYFVTFTDIGTRLTWVTELKDKTQVFPSFVDWLAEAERQSGKQLKVLRTDNGGEFINKVFNDYLKAKGIRRQRTISHTPQHNSIAERGEGEEKVYLLLYVDDILVAGALEDRVEEVCAHIAAVFKVKQIPRATLFLGMNLERDQEGKKLLLYQKKYIHRLQERFGTRDCTKAVTTPLSSLSEKEVNPEEELIQWGGKERALKAYQSRVGSVMYPVSCTRVDVAHAARFLGQNVLQPEDRKWKEMQRTITYLQQRGEEGLLYEGGEEAMELIGYADASHASDKKDRKGAYGYVFLLCGTAITWQGKKLNDMALSSAEAEYMALFYACQEGVLQRFGFRYSSPQSTLLPTGHLLSAPPSDESVEPSGPYPELVGCLIHRPEHWEAAKRVLHYLCSTSGMGLVLGGRGPVVLTGHTDASWVDDSATQRSSQGYAFNLGSGSVSWRSTCLSSVLSSSCEAEIYAGAMSVHELRRLTYLLTDLGERPRSSLFLYVVNKAMIALCQEHRLEHRTKHMALRYFLARELQQRGQLRLAYVATRANTPDIFTKALPPGDHQRFSTVLGRVPTLPHLLTV